MPKQSKHVLVLYDLPEKTEDHDDIQNMLKNNDRPTERDVVAAIKKLGLQLSIHGVFDDVLSLWKTIEIQKPDVVFNLCETFQGRRIHEGDIASILELLGVHYTGSKPASLHLCKDKGATKKIAKWEGVIVPSFKTFHQEHFDFSQFDAQFPLIVKPLDREASEGISQASIVHDWKSCEERVIWIIEKLKSDVIVEEYIHGRELYVGVVENAGAVCALPPRELFMTKREKELPMIATYKAKWDDAYREKWGISTGKAAKISNETLEQLSAQSVAMFKALGLTGYARIDWRLTDQGEPVFLEANPNPALSQDDDFALAAKMANYSYGELIAEIIGSANGCKDSIVKDWLRGA